MARRQGRNNIGKINMKRVIIAAVVLVLVLIVTPIISYSIMTGAVSNTEQAVNFEIKSGTAANQVVLNLEEAGLIKSASFTKISMRLNGLSDFKQGIFTIPQNATAKEVLTILNTPPVQDTVNVTIPEGFWAEQIAKAFAEQTNVEFDEFVTLWQDDTFLKEMIDRYAFLDEQILDPGVRYGVEGFLFPNTYNVFSRSSSARSITIMMLDEMERQLAPLQAEIDATGWSTFDLIVFSSIIEYEARSFDDRVMVAGVFLNRIDIGMRFESCATVSYALNEHLFRVTYEQANTPSPYNTYMIDGLPIGPVMNPSISSIKATIQAINDKNSGNGHEYLFFMSDIQNTQQTFFARTYEEHQQNVDKYLD